MNCHTMNSALILIGPQADLRPITSKLSGQLKIASSCLVGGAAGALIAYQKTVLLFLFGDNSYTTFISRDTLVGWLQNSSI